jgi:hypothetical protein
MNDLAGRGGQFNTDKMAFGHQVDTGPQLSSYGKDRGIWWDFPPAPRTDRKKNRFCVTATLYWLGGFPMPLAYYPLAPVFSVLGCIRSGATRL